MALHLTLVKKKSTWKVPNHSSGHIVGFQQPLVPAFYLSCSPLVAPHPPLRWLCSMFVSFICISSYLAPDVRLACITPGWIIWFPVHVPNLSSSSCIISQSSLLFTIPLNLKQSANLITKPLTPLPHDHRTCCIKQGLTSILSLPSEAPKP